MWYWKLYSEEYGSEVSHGFAEESDVREDIQLAQSIAKKLKPDVIYCYSKPYYRLEGGN